MAFGKLVKGRCKNCDHDRIITHKSLGLCMYCNDTRKKEAKKAKAGGDDQSTLEFFMEIYESRIDTWVSDVSGEPLPRPPQGYGPKYDFAWSQFVSCFSHIIHKSGRGGKRFAKDHRNIACVTPHEHTQWGERQWEIKDDSRWDTVRAVRDGLLRELL